MPTGYTAELMEKGMSFKKFATLCARAMGVCILMWDEPLSTPIPEEFKPDSHHLEYKQRAVEEVAELKAMTDKQRLAYGRQEIAESLAGAKESLAKHQGENDRLLDMQKRVSLWAPPTPDHENFKVFMLDQLKTSMNSTSYSVDAITRMSQANPTDLWRTALERAEGDIEYHEKGYAEECQRAAERTAWVKALRDSLAAIEE